MSVAYRRWELGGGAPGVGYKKITGSPQVHHHHQYVSENASAVLRRQQQQQQQQQQQHHQQPHEPCNLSSTFSIYMQQCNPAAAAAAGGGATISTTNTATTGAGENHKIHIPGGTVRVSSSSSSCPLLLHPQTLPVHWDSGTAYHADASRSQTMSSSTQEKAELLLEQQRWGGMMMMGAVAGSGGVGGGVAAGGDGHHKRPGALRLEVSPQYYGVQGGLSLMMHPPKEEEEEEEEIPATNQKVENSSSRNNSSRIVDLLPQEEEEEEVVVVVHGQQCVQKKKKEKEQAPSPLPLLVLPLPPPPCSPSSSSSICDGREQSSGSSQEDGCGGDVEAQSAYRGPLDQMSALESSLPIKRPGLSKFFGGKSRSFSSLGDVSSVSDLVKPNNPYAKRRRLGLNAPLDRHRSYPPISRASVVGISKRPANRSSGSTLTVAIKLGGLTEKDKDCAAGAAGAAVFPGSSSSSTRISFARTAPSRSFSLTDLPVVSNPSSPPFRRSFAQP